MISIFESYIRNSRDPYTISIINSVTVSMYSVIGMAKPISIHFYREEKLVELSKRASRTTHDDCPLLLATHPERCARLSASSLSCIQRTFRITCSPHGRNHAPMTGRILIWRVEKNSLRPGRGVVAVVATEEARWIPTVIGPPVSVNSRL